MLVMGLMRFSQANQVFVLGGLEPAEPTMDEHIVDQEICKAVQEDTKTYKKSIIPAVLSTKIDEQDTGNCKDQEEEIIAFKGRSISGLMMVLVKIPQQTMHDVFMRQPGDSFHDQKC
jgi:hypothetical protein